MRYLAKYGNFIKEGHWEKSVDLVCNDCGYQWKGFETSEMKTIGKRGCICPECMSDNIDYDYSKENKDKKEKKESCINTYENLKRWGL